MDARALSSEGQATRTCLDGDTSNCASHRAPHTGRTTRTREEQFDHQASFSQQPRARGETPSRGSDNVDKNVVVFVGHHV